MKIAIVVNTFDTDLNRFKLANQSYERLAAQDGVDVFDIQKPGIAGKFKTVDNLSRYCCDVIEESTKQLPFVNDLFNIAADLDYDYFIVSNADVMISPRLINYINGNGITAMPCSRLDVKPVNNIHDNMVPVRWEIAGFDTFCFKTDWYKAHSDLFEDFILGKPYYDQHYATLMKVFGGNDTFGNKNPAMCLHEHHGIASCLNKDIEYNFNENQYNTSELAQTYKHIWDNYLPKLINRQPYMSFLKELDKESEFERAYFEAEVKKLKNKINEDKRKCNIV
jgi:hypothetical protein